MSLYSRADICNANGLGNTTMCPVCENILKCSSWKLVEACSLHKLTYYIDNPLTVFFSLFMAVWTVLFYEFWKRQQSRLQFRWDVVDFEKNQTIRPEFERIVFEDPKLNQLKRKNPITDVMKP